MRKGTYHIGPTAKAQERLRIRTVSPELLSLCMHDLSLSLLSNYRNDPKFWDRYAWAKVQTQIRLLLEEQ